MLQLDVGDHTHIEVEFCELLMDVGWHQMDVKIVVSCCGRQREEELVMEGQFAAVSVQPILWVEFALAFSPNAICSLLMQFA